MIHSYWQTEWLLYEKVEFDGINRLIIVHPDVNVLDIRADVYSAWVRWVERSSWATQAIRFSGADTIPGGETGVTFFTANGWKLIYDPAVVAVSGVLYSDDYATPYFSADDVPLFPATVSALVNSAVTTQNVVTGTVVTPSEIWEYVDRQLTVASGMTAGQEAKIDAIPTNPLLTTDNRLDNIDTPISGITGTTPAEIWEHTTRELTVASGLTVSQEAKLDAIPTTDNVADLTPVLSAIGALNNITAADVEAALLNEGDGQQIVNALVTAIGNSNVDEIALVAAIRADIERVGGLLNLVPSATWLEATRTLTATLGLTAVQEAKIDAIPTAPVLASDPRLDYLDVPVSDGVISVAQDAQLMAIPLNPLLTNDARLTNLDAPVSGVVNLDAATVWSYTTRELTVPVGLTVAQDTTLSALPSASENAQELLETQLPASPTIGSVGELLKKKILTIFRFNAYK